MNQYQSNTKEKSKKYNLPILELGIGICYQDAPPAYLLDGKKRIMISPAINLADRLSSCHKTLIRVLDNKNHAFNLYVFETGKEAWKEEFLKKLAKNIVAAILLKRKTKNIN